jgi:DNA-binding NarL/FixJ family response regulator
MDSNGTEQQQPAKRILIADSFRLYAEACKALLDPEFDVVAVVSDGAEIPGVAAGVAPDVVVADAEMPRLDMLKSLGKSSAEKTAPKLVMLRVRFGRETAVEQLRRGASAIVSKQSGAADLLEGVRLALAGGHYVSANITRAAVQSLVREATSRKRQRQLTDRQQQIIRLMTQGVSAKEIAYRLGITQGNVYFHKYRVMSVLNLSSNAELFRYVVQHGGAN